MQSSLGIYIDNNIIKYAKLQKDKDAIKVEAYNVAFYENDLESILKKIISETYSYKVPISINISDEIYNTFDVSTLLSKQDLKKAINIEYEMLCSEKGYNRALLEHRYILADKKEDSEKKKVLSIIDNKNEIAKRVALLSGNRVSTVTPISTSIGNLIETDARENIIIVNIESKTKITTIIDGQISSIDVFDDGMTEILENINRVENSYSKSYEVCKNMTIYTQNSSDLYSDTDEYMSTVTSTLFKIADTTRTIINQLFVNIDKIYITGLATCINNIGLYFQDYIPTVKCEILKPYFIKNASMQVPIKEYIEVNSAIALALDGLGMVNGDVNFIKGAKSSAGSKLKAIGSTEINMATIKNLGYNIKADFVAPMKSLDKLLLRGIVACLIIAVVYLLFSNNIARQLEEKNAKVQTAIANTNTELSKLDSDISIISGRTSAYNTLITELTNPAEVTSTDNGTETRIIAKDSIPNLLNRIMFVIPQKVKITSIKNTTDTHIEIKAEAEKYEQLGYFKAVLSTSNILQNVKSTPGQKTGNVVEVTIEGDLP